MEPAVVVVLPPKQAWRDIPGRKGELDQLLAPSREAETAKPVSQVLAYDVRESSGVFGRRFNSRRRMLIAHARQILRPVSHAGAIKIGTSRTNRFHLLLVLEKHLAHRETEIAKAG
jgi:hypothetical protein